MATAHSGLSSLIKDHLAGGASRLAALLLTQIRPVSSVVAPCQTGAALRDLVLVQRGQTTSRFAIAFAVLASICVANGSYGAQGLPAQSPTFGIGRAPNPDQLKQIDIDVTPDGKGLPRGSGTAAKGKDVYTRRCETCHGPTGKEGPQDVLSGGKGSLATSAPQKTVGSYWPYATTLWDYINRAMPFDHPSTLTPDEVYSAAAYVLFLNGIVGEQDVLNEATLPKVQMPNRNGFVADPRPDVPAGKRIKN